MNTATFSSVATQLMITDKVELGGKRLAPRRVGHQRLKSVSFSIEGREQIAEKPSRWGKLAREGHQVVQFKEARSGKFIAVAVDGKVIEYGSRAHRASFLSRERLDDRFGDRVGVLVEHEVAAVEIAQVGRRHNLLYEFRGRRQA